ncbi:hypothetical protein AGMMS50262_23970 [Bacteroidia bacterium]|nr:hypothetical protein AGMMS50262_23970 [Bacteroidia bacterium]
MDEKRPIMHIEHKAGDKLYVDFTGHRLYLRDKACNQHPVEVLGVVNK